MPNKTWDDVVAQATDTDEAQVLAAMSSNDTAVDLTPSMKPSRQSRHTRTSRLGTLKAEAPKPTRALAVHTFAEAQKQPKKPGVRHLLKKAAETSIAIDDASAHLANAAGKIDSKRGNKGVRALHMR